MADSVPGSGSSTVQLPIDSYLDGAIEVAGDHDWYGLSLTAGRTYVLETSRSGSADLDTLITLRTAGGAYVTSNDDGGMGQFSKIVYTPSFGGAYFIDVGAYNEVATGAFRISATVTNAAPVDAIPAGTQTTASVTTGSTVTGSVETAGDHDWYRLTLNAGQTYHLRTVATGGNADVDTTLALRDASGLQIASNDDTDGLYSFIDFTARTNGTYFLDVGGSGLKTGAYQLSVAADANLPVYSTDQIAAQLTNGYWGGASHRFNVAPGGTLSVNITGLTASGKTLARDALAVWADVSGIGFSEVSTGGQIIFDDNNAGAFTSSNFSSDGTIVRSTINIGTQWLATYGTNTGSYSFQTYLHEIGHALGLGHAGDYNGDESSAGSVLYANDAWSTTVMSYYSQGSSSYFAGQGFSTAYLVTPMVADDVAIANLYGANTQTRTADTIYGFHNTSGRAIYDATVNPKAAYTVYDNGGRDTLDYSGFSHSQVIDLRAESFSNVGGLVGNVTIARDAVIENAIGGSGSDFITGNDVANILKGGAGDDHIQGGGGDDIITGGSGFDVLAGGSGADTFLDTAAGLSGDVIVDFSVEDRITFSDAVLASFRFAVSNGTLTYSGGSLTFSGGKLSASAALGGGVTLALLAGAGSDQVTPSSDFDGDGQSDILWRHANGSVSTWSVTGNPQGKQLNQSVFNATVDTQWKIVDTMDFNGDGRADILWRHANGSLSLWNASGNGSFQQGSYNDRVGTDWTIAAVGDYNADGEDDLLWHHANGSVSIWSSTGTTFQQNTYSHAPVSTDWKIEGSADFNGDGRVDVLWRNDSGELSIWTATEGGFAEATFSAQIGREWHIAGLADFDGDSRADILWRHDNGSVSVWSSSGSSFDQATYNTRIGTDWTIAATDDFNGDGRADIAWRHTNGSLSTWESNGHSFDQSIANAQVGTDWSIIGYSGFF